MPNVGGTEFPYTKAGIQKAKAWAEMTGKPMKMKKYKKGGKASLDPSSLEEVAHKSINSGTRQAVQYEAMTKGGQQRHIIQDIEGLTNKEQKRKIAFQALREQIRANPEFADTVSARQAAEFMNMRDRSLWDMLKGILPQFQEGGEVPQGRRMYGTRKKKKSLQTADVGPVRGYAKGGKVKMPKGYHT